MQLVKWALMSLAMVVAGMFIVNRVPFLRNLVMGTTTV